MPASLEQLRAGLEAAMVGAEPGPAAADRLCAACVEFLDVDGAALSLVSNGASQGTFGASDEQSRRVDDHQFTLGEGPCLDAVGQRVVVLAPDLDAPEERRWPLYADAVLGEGVRAVFALPVMVASVAVGALDLFRHLPGPLTATHLAGGGWAAELATRPLLDLVARVRAAEQAPGSEEGATDAFQRVEVYQATGMLIAQLDVDASEALVRLRAHAMASGQTASEVAWAIIQRRLVLPKDDDRHDRGSGA